MKTAQAPPLSTLAAHPWIPYVAPMAAYVLISSLEGQLPHGPSGTPHPTWYPLAYAAKAAIVALLIYLGRSTWRDLRPWPSRPVDWALSVGLGLAVTAAWVGLDGLYPRFGATGSRESFDPTVMPPVPRAAFIAVRMLGLVALVPLFEELFWRSFLNRLVIDPDDFRRVPVGRVTLASALVTSVAFAAIHPEWLPALLTGLAWAWLLRRTGGVGACVISHAVANLALGIYVLSTGSWRFW